MPAAVRQSQLFAAPSCGSRGDHLIQPVLKLFDEQRAVCWSFGFADGAAERHQCACCRERTGRPSPDRVQDRRFEAGIGAQQIADFRRVAVHLGSREEDRRGWKPTSFMVRRSEATRVICCSSGTISSRGLCRRRVSPDELLEVAARELAERGGVCPEQCRKVQISHRVVRDRRSRRATTTAPPAARRPPIPSHFAPSRAWCAPMSAFLR